MAKPNPVLIKAYLESLLASLNNKKSDAAKPQDENYSALMNRLFENTKEQDNG